MFSAYNDRSKCFKNYKFDVVFDTAATQENVFS